MTNIVKRHLNFQRLGYLARNDFFQVWRRVLLISSIIGGLIFFDAIIRKFFGGNPLDYNGRFNLAMVIWGCLAASRAFPELHNRNRNDDFLLLPASTLEKMLIRLTFVSFALPLFIMLLMFVLSILIESLLSILFQTSMSSLNIFNPLEPKHWQLIRLVIIAQSVYFLGSVWFKRAQFIKTFLALNVLGLLLMLFLMLIIKIFLSEELFSLGGFANLGGGIRGEWAENFIFSSGDKLSPSIKRILSIFEVVCLILWGPFCWIVSYLRIREIQSSDAI